MTTRRIYVGILVANTPDRMEFNPFAYVCESEDVARKLALDRHAEQYPGCDIEIHSVQVIPNDMILQAARGIYERN
jgi:hypothetical protein